MPLGRSSHSRIDHSGIPGELGRGMIVDNQSDPPTAVTTLVAPGATISGDEATLPAGGFQPVACVLACDAAFNVHDVGNVDVLWDALYDNFWDLNPLLSIPDGLGLDFDFDGSSSLIVPSEAGIWALSYFGQKQIDESWVGSFRVGGLGLHIPWVPPRSGAGPGDDPYMAGSVTTSLPAGTQLTHQVATTVQAQVNPKTVTQIYLAIVRLG